MKKLSQVLLLLTSVALTASSVLLISAMLRRKTRLTKIADEGYETAHDILYPTRADRYKLHFGPVFPEN